MPVARTEPPAARRLRRLSTKGGHVNFSWRSCSCPPIGLQQARDAPNLARLRPIFQLREVSSDHCYRGAENCGSR